MSASINRLSINNCEHPCQVSKDQKQKRGTHSSHQLLFPTGGEVWRREEKVGGEEGIEERGGGCGKGECQ